LRYVVAIQLPKSDKVAINVGVLCILSITASATLISLLIWLFSPEILAMLSMESLLPYVWLVVLAVVGAGAYEVLSNWSIRKGDFRRVSRTLAWQSLSGVTAKLLLGVLSIKPLGLLIGQIMQQAGGVLGLYRHAHAGLKTNWRHVNIKTIYLVARYYIDMPKYRLPSQLLLSVSSQAPLLISAAIFGVEATGQLGLALMALLMPIELFGRSAGQAYYAETAKIGKQYPDKLLVVTKSVVKRLFLIGLVPTLALFLFGEWFFEIAFGSKWEMAGRLASILSIYLLFQFIASPIVNVLSVINQQSLFLRINLVRAALTAGSLIIPHALGLDIYHTVFIYSLTMVAHRAFVYAQIVRALRRLC